MGLDRTVRFAVEETPTWEAIRGHLLRVGESPALRLIDGVPAFPEELPPTDWKELRIALGGGMVTIRRGPGFLSCVVWGNADESLELAWNKAVWACAAAGKGLVETASGPASADDFARSAGLSPE
jgi:hypothetical protein